MNQEERIRCQFGKRKDTFNKSAQWMENKELINAHLELTGKPKKDQDHCLDVCCGTGIMGTAFKRHGWNVKGIDLTPEFLEIASQNIETTLGNVEKIPYKNNSFDIAVIRQSYKLINGPNVLKEISRILKPKGKFILGQSISFSEKDEVLYRKIQEARHINMMCYYTHDEFIKELEQNAFSVLKYKQVVVRESVDHWLKYALSLSDEQKLEIKNFILHAPQEYKEIHEVELIGDELFENWNWHIYLCENQKKLMFIDRASRRIPLTIAVSRIVSKPLSRFTKSVSSANPSSVAVDGKV